MMYQVSKMNYEDKFESYMQNEKGAAKSTLSAYISDIREFTDFLAERGKQPEKANKADQADDRLFVDVHLLFRIRFQIWFRHCMSRIHQALSCFPAQAFS